MFMKKLCHTFFVCVLFFFKRHKAYRDEQARLHAAWLERENARQAAIARGDPNPPAFEPDPSDEAAVREIGLLGLCKFLVYVLLVVLLAGKFVAGEWLWGWDGVGAANVRRTVDWLWPGQMRLFSEGLLGEFDGTDPHKPIYLAVRFCVCVCVCVCRSCSRVLFLFLFPVRVSLPCFLLLSCRVAAGRLTELFYCCRSMETFMMCQVIVASMVQEGPMHSCTLATLRGLQTGVY